MNAPVLYMGDTSLETAASYLAAWFEADVACVGMGSNLITKELLAAKDYKGITAKVKEAIELIVSIRKGK